MNTDLDTTEDEAEEPVMSDDDIIAAFKKIGVPMNKKSLEAGKTLMKADLSKIAAPAVLRLLLNEVEDLELYDRVLVSAVKNVDIDELKDSDGYDDMDEDEIRIQTHKDLISSKATITNAKMKVVAELSKFMDYEPHNSGGSGAIKRRPPAFGPAVQVNVGKGESVEVKESAA